MATATAPPLVSEELQTGVYDASQWKLMWLSFRKHKLAMVGLAVVLIGYAVALFGEFIAPYDPEHRDAASQYVPPMRPRIFDDGLRAPFVYALDEQQDPVTRITRHEPIRDQRLPLRFFVRGDRWSGWIDADADTKEEPWYRDRAPSVRRVLHHAVVPLDLGRTQCLRRPFE